MRTLTFTQIVDDRFDTNLEKTLSQRTDAILERLRSNGIRVIHGGIIEAVFGENTQLRRQFWVSKPKTITWDGVYRLINEVKAVPYKFVDMDWDALENENIGY